jgi:Fusaric acid resistance protein-like
MSPTTGSSISGFIARALGAITGGLLAMAAWYIVVGHPPGVIVFALVVLVPHYYFLVQDIRRVQVSFNALTVAS